MFSNSRIKALALVGLVLPVPAAPPTTLEGLAGRGYRAAIGSDKVADAVYPGRSESGGGTGGVERVEKGLRRGAVGVLALLALGDSGSVRSLTTVNLSTLTSDRSLGRGVA